MQSSDKLEIHEYLHTSISSGFFFYCILIFGRGLEIEYLNLYRDILQRNSMVM